MNDTPRETIAPSNSLIAGLITGAYFSDAWSVRAGEPDLSALGQFLKAAKSTPAWVSTCMSLRNRVVALFGLKNLGALEALKWDQDERRYKPGDRVGIFTLFEHTPDEVLLGDRDKHLDVTVSVHKARPAHSAEATITVTTVVKVHNWLGRVYMLPVGPMHRVIAPAVLRAVAAKPNAT